MAVDLTRAAVVVAHPDDEILWFSSLAPKVRRIVMCYGAISPRSQRAENRRKLVEAYPLDTVEFLDLPIPGAAAAADPLHLAALADRLGPALEGITTVFTHNPWGEYGQADHRRVHAAIEALRHDHGFAVYVSGYVARHQRAELDLALRRGVGDVVSYPTAKTEIGRIVRLYKAHSCWTWTPHWSWPKREHFLRLDGGAATRPPEIPIHLFGSRHKSRAEMRQFWRRLFGARPKELLVAIPARGDG